MASPGKPLPLHLQHSDADRRKEDVRFVVSEVDVGIGKFVVGGLAVLLVVGACNNADESETGQSAATSGASVAAAADNASGGGGGSATGEPSSSTSPVGTPSVTAQETGVVATVVDGDTLALTDGRVVRVLGIDSCELVTHSGTSTDDTCATSRR